MSGFRKFLPYAAAMLLALPAAAHAVTLTVVNVGAPAINCVFNPTCTITVTDSVGSIALPGNTAAGRLQSRTFYSIPGTVAAGLMGYDYRVDMTAASSSGTPNCVTQLVLDFGGAGKLAYSPGGFSNVFVITSGGLGSVGIASAVKIGNNVTFTFSAPVCPGQTSYFFGLSNPGAPTSSTAHVQATVGGTFNVPARVPVH